jgi:hypothetical protein
MQDHVGGGGGVGDCTYDSRGTVSCDDYDSESDADSYKDLGSLAELLAVAVQQSACAGGTGLAVCGSGSVGGGVGDATCTTGGNAAVSFSGVLTSDRCDGGCGRGRLLCERRKRERLRG